MPETVFAAFEETAARAGGADFLADPSADFTLGYGDALRQIGALVGRYRAAGYGHGHRVALLLENRPAFLLHWLALNALGVAVVPVNPYYRRRELTHLLRHSGTILAVVLSARLDEVRAAAGPVTVATAENIPPAASAPPFDSAPGKESLCGLLYTSGTTGEPKGCLLSNDYYLRMGRWYVSQGGLCAVETGSERLLTPLPLYHMNAMACSFMAMVLSGGCLIQLDRFHPAAWWDDVANSGATIIHYLGIMPALLLARERREVERRHRVRFGFGANVDPAHHAAFEARFGFPLIEAWAMTETGAGACIAANRAPRHPGTRCFGRPESCETKIVDEAGGEVATGEEGELLVRHGAEAPRRGFFSGYHGDAAASEAAWTGGWFHTGDVVREGPDGSLHFIDRRKNVIRRSGENIAALEVESVILELDWVAQAAVIAVPDALRGEEVMAYIVAAEGAPRGAAAARRVSAWCLENLSYYKAPGWLIFRDALPLTTTQKVRKAELRALGDDPAALPGCFDLRDLKRPGRTA
jgi:acyl-CoA synthetase (AMP-forming)/AMP-acid ligase II